MERIYVYSDMKQTWLAVVSFLAAIVIANLLVVWLGPQITVINAFVLIAFDLTIRDVLHDKWHGHGLFTKMTALISAGSLLSFIVNMDAGRIALASLVAFFMASASDGLVYHYLRRLPWFRRANLSNIVGAAVDSFVFPTVAFGVILPEIVFGQFVAKLLGGIVWTTVFSFFRKKKLIRDHVSLV